jgi:hypothetical protein
MKLILTTLMEMKMIPRLGYKWMVTLVATTVFITLAGLARAAEFSAETVIDRLGRKQKVKVYVKGKRMHEEMVDTFGQKQILITGPGKGQFHTQSCLSFSPVKLAVSLL